MPLLISLIVSVVASRMYPAPTDMGPRVLWWCGLLLLASVAVWAVDGLLRRLLPLAALLEMSILFPGRAPSRFSVARQAGGTRQLEDLVANARKSDENTEPVIAAGRILALVGALRGHDRVTRGHSERVRVFTDLIAEQMGLPAAERDRLRWAALLHDIGKLDVPARILNKPGKPTSREWSRLQQHPATGQELAAPLLGWLGASAPVIIQHHERWDGTGYPAGLKGTKICIGARIVAVADALEVMTAPRSYKKAVSRAVALRELTTMAGSQFDPAVVRALLSISSPRLRWVIGLSGWLAQVPVIGTAPSIAGVSTVLGQAAAGAGALGLGAVVGLTAATPAPRPVDVAPHVRPAAVLESPAVVPTATGKPSPATRVPAATTSPAATGKPATPGATVHPSASRSPSPSPTRVSPSPSPSPLASKPPSPLPLPTASPSPSPSPSRSPSPRPRPSRSPEGH